MGQSAHQLRRELWARYYESATWGELSARCKELAHGVCVVCMRRKATVAHHIVYPLDPTLTTLDDLVACCESCHRNAPTWGHNVPA
jgi:5-methylcytosine-specific restriction endonuclease McrA